MAGAERHRVVVVGGGFGGLQAARGLRRTPVDVTIVDRRNFHLFQPLLYQVATGALSPAEIAVPLRVVFRRQQNAHVVLAEVGGFDLDGRRVLLDRLANGDSGELEYDTLIVSGGSLYSYFGHDEWQPFTPALKSLEDALAIRSRILLAFEAAEAERDPVLRQAWLTFVVVGGGPTGVELAGQIGEIARDTLPRDFRAIDPREARILLVEAGDRLLATFPPRLSAKAARALEQLGVTPLVGRAVVGIDEESVTIDAPGGGEPEHVPAQTVIWAAGVVASPLAAELGGERDRYGRIAVGPDLTIPGRPEVLAIGDMVVVHDAEGKPVPLLGVAPVAMQQGRFAAKVVRERLAGREPPPFRYFDKGNVATIGRAKAVADIKGLQLSGLPAWLLWLVLHLFYLIGFQNRILVLIRWMISFFTRGRGARLITGETVGAPARAPRS